MRKIAQARQFITERLAAGPMQALAICAAATQRGISLRTLRRAKGELGVIAYQRGWHGPWHWKLRVAFRPINQVRGGFSQMAKLKRRRQLLGYI